MAVAQRVSPPVPVAAGDEPATNRAVTWLFTATAFLGAGLLFLVEPLVAKLLLPDFGGSATVWSTCTLFFQALLLVAYGYCHWSTSRLRRWQPRTHLLVLALPLLALPLTVPADAAPPAGAMPAWWLIRTLVVLVGLPFVVVATTGPLLQKWYSWTSSRRAEDPYFLFAASNLGSFVGLLAYPFWVEPTLPLAAQRDYWSLAYVVFLVLTGSCAVVAGRARPRRRVPPPQAPVTVETSRPVAGRVPARRMFVWAALAMLPSTLMLGATAHLSTDVASIPLLWVVPLALYLGSFVLAFARTSRKVPLTATKIAVALALLELVVTFSGPLLPIWLSLSTSLLMLATVAYAAHSRLAVDRPAPEHLTTYYMVIASGGALGGLLNGFVAPAVFSSVLEYPLALGAVPLLLVGARSGGRLRQYLAGNLIRVTIVVLLVVCVVPGVRILLVLRSGDLRLAIVLLAVVLLTGWLLTQNAALALVAVLALALTNVLVANHGVLDRSRTFYGSYRVVGDAGLHTFFHGTTVHGTQFGDPRRRDVPTTYYSRSGPLGDVFSVLDAHGLETVGAVGLGAGTLATYGRPGQRFTFFEIDPGVVRIAEDPRFFTYLRDSAASIRTVTGDGRLSLEKEPPASYDLLVLDAFSSDSIPVHLLTQEAIRMYASRLTPDGVLAFHVTNRLFDLQPVLHAAASSMGWTALVRTDDTPVAGATHSTWVLLGRDGAAVRALAGRPHWRPLAGAGVTWTDDYSSLLSVLR